MNRELAKNAKVLIIDDQQLAQNFLKRALESLGFSYIVMAESAKHALRQCEDHAFNVIICSFNLSRDKDGFHLFEEFKHRGIISLTTSFIFISADTGADLVNSVVELQPDEFLAKPFTPRELSLRLNRVLTRKQKLNNVYTALDQKRFKFALGLIDRHLQNPKLARLSPLLMRLKGDALLATKDWSEAERYFRDTLNLQKFTWASVGLAKALIAQDKDDEALEILEELVKRPETRLAALDMLAHVHVNQSEFDSAYQDTQRAAEISPRNIDRHKNTINLARLVHDHGGQFEAAKAMVKFARRSVHDTPDLYMTVARAGVDYALTLTEQESNTIVRQSERYLEEVKTNFPNDESVRDNLTVVQARLHYIKSEEDKAKHLIQNLMHAQTPDKVEDALDRAKAFHELGYHEKAVEMLDSMEGSDESNDAVSEKVLQEFIKQETKERKEIRYSPRELNNMAVAFYGKNQLAPAIQAFSDAFRIMPKNERIALNLLQVLADMKVRNGLDESRTELFYKCQTLLASNELAHEQQKRFEKIMSSASGEANTVSVRA